MNSQKSGAGDLAENRSFEYDSMTPDYAEFLIEELLPIIEKKYQITQNPELRAICGNSSGGICAFTVAWHRPESFGKCSATSVASWTFVVATIIRQ